MKWTPEEDAVLIQNIGTCSTKKAAYRTTSEQLVNRSAGACEDRWSIIKETVTLKQEVERLRKEKVDVEQMHEELLTLHYQYIDKNEKLKVEVENKDNQIVRASEQKKQDDVVIAELKRLNSQIKAENEESLEEYHQLLKIMNKARQMHVDEEYPSRKRTFKMDYNGNLEYAR